MESLSLIQANLARAYKANENLCIFQQENANEISLIQEPYLLNNKLIGFPIKHRIFAAPAGAKVATVIHDTNVEALPIRVRQTLIAVGVTWRKQKMLIINCYAPPRDDINDTIQEIEEVLETTSYERIVVLGDFNAKSTVWGGNKTDDRGKTLSEFIISKNWYIQNECTSLPTFQTVNGRSWIDVTIISPNLIREVQEWTVLDHPTASDHRYIKISLFKAPEEKTRRLTMKGEEKVLNNLKEDEWFNSAGAVEIKTARELDETIDTLYEKIEKLREKYTKLVQNNNEQAKPWWNVELEIERKRTIALRKRYQKSTGPEREVHKTKYYEAHKIYVENISKAKQASWKEMCSAMSKGNPFNLPYKIARNKLKKPLALGLIQKENSEQTETEEDTVRYLIGSLYPTVSEFPGTDEQEPIVQAGDGDIEHPFNSLEVDIGFRNLRNNVAPGPDGIRTPFWKKLYSYHPLFFQNIFNTALRIGYFPKKWKASKIILIPKSGNPPGADATKCTRPIAINSIPGKVLEKLIKNRLYYFLNQKGLLHSNQFGFRHRTSTTNALRNVTQKVRETKGRGENAIIIALDISNAFHSISADHIAERLLSYNCPGNLRAVCTAAVKNRSLMYQCGDRKLEFKIGKGSPQGSPLSPLLWNITVSSLLDRSFPEGVHVQAFADDIIMIVAACSRKALEQRANSSLEIAAEWARDTGVKFNTAKSKMLVMDDKYGTKPPKVVMEGGKITKENLMKILGVVFDPKLTFLPHLEYVQKTVRSLNHKLCAFAGIDWGFTGNKLKVVYKKAIERIIVYAAPVWYSNHPHKLRKLQAIQRPSLIKITQAYRTAPNNSLCVLAGVPPVHLIIEKEIALYRILQEGQSFHWEGIDFEKDKIATKFDKWKQHPSEVISIPFDAQSNREVELKIYTDGSGKEEGVGAAFVVFNAAGRQIEARKIKLPKYSNNFEAEGVAILKAIEYIQTLTEVQCIQILTDSLSSLMALANPDNQNELINLIKAAYRAVKGRVTVYFTYVKAHSGIYGNEVADELAKEAVITGTYLEVPISKKFINKELTRTTYEKWNKMWSADNREAPLYQWVRNVKQIPEHFPTNQFTTQALTGHGKFPFYLQRFGIRDDTNCKCGNTAEDIDHYLRECNLTKQLREDLAKRHRGKVVEAKPEITKDKGSLLIIEEMIKTVNAQAI